MVIERDLILRRHPFHCFYTYALKTIDHHQRVEKKGPLKKKKNNKKTKSTNSPFISDANRSHFG